MILLDKSVFSEYNIYCLDGLDLGANWIRRVRVGKIRDGVRVAL